VRSNVLFRDKKPLPTQQFSTSACGHSFTVLYLTTKENIHFLFIFCGHLLFLTHDHVYILYILSTSFKWFGICFGLQTKESNYAYQNQVLAQLSNIVAD